MNKWMLTAAAAGLAALGLSAQSSAPGNSRGGASLEQRVRAQDDREAILKTLYQYAYTVDFGHDPREYTDLYTEDALFQSIASSVPGNVWNLAPTARVGTEGGPGAVVGRQGLEKWIMNEWQMRDRLLAAGHFRIHAMMEPDITVDGDRASAHSYFQTTDNDNGRIYIVSIGVYKDQLVRGADGRWRIKERLLLRQGGNAGTASGAQGASSGQR